MRADKGPYVYCPLIDSLRPEETVFLVGAGLSIDGPSWIPPAAPLTALLVDWICADAPDLRPRLAHLLLDPALREPWKGPWATLRFELLLQWLEYIEPKLFEVLAGLDTNGIPNRWHRFLAERIREGARVLTTNFDTRVEQACDDLGIDCRVVVLSAARPDPRDLAAAGLVKLHGSFGGHKRGFLRRHAPVGTLSRIARLGFGFGGAQTTRTSLLSILSTRSVIVSGYSAWDSFDIVPLLEEAGRAHPLVWHDWCPDDRFLLRPAVPVDPLLDRSRRSPPHRLLLGELARRHPGRVFSANASTPRFFEWLAGSPPPSWFGRELPVSLFQRPKSGIEVLREILLSDGYAMDADAARTVVESLEGAYGSMWDEPWERAGREGSGHGAESVVVAGDGVDGPYGDDDPPPWQLEVHALLDSGRIRRGAEVFLAQLDLHGPSGGGLLFDEVALELLSDLFYKALHEQRDLEAWRIARRLRREADRRASLWAQVYARYLEALIQHRWSLGAATSRRRLRHPPIVYVSRTAELLDFVIRFAPRVPHLRMMVDALRFRRQVEADPKQRRRFERALVRWALLLPACEEKELALMDAVRFASKSTPAPRLCWLFEQLRHAVSEPPNSKRSGAYLEIGRCYLALGVGDRAEFSRGVEALRTIQTKLKDRDVAIELDLLETLKK